MLLAMLLALRNSTMIEEIATQDSEEREDAKYELPDIVANLTTQS